VIVVVDSGIWISAIEYGGIPRAAIQRISHVDILAICAQIENEVLGVLSRKFGRDPQAARERFYPLRGEATRIEITGEVAGVCRDPKDDCILECALKAGAQLIVTGDHDLLSLGEFRNIRIITARQYIDLAAST
jgi:uncharacterized protein